MIKDACLDIMLIYVCLFLFTQFFSKLDCFVVDSRGRDLTEVAAAVGEDVVDATLQKVGYYLEQERKPIFLKRIALVESNFGKNQNVMRSNPAGGIWQISPNIYSSLLKTTASSNKTTKFLNKIRRIFHYDCFLCTYNYSSPLKSALASILFIDIKLGPVRESSVKEQAVWWSSIYNKDGNSTQFVEESLTFDIAKNCQNESQIDLFFLVDGSLRVAEDDFETELQFVYNLGSNFNVSLANVRLGLSSYSFEEKNHFHFNQSLSLLVFQNSVLVTTRSQVGTQTGKALLKVLDDGFSPSTGARLNIPRVVFVITDETSSDDLSLPVKIIEEAEIAIFVIAIGNKTNNSQLQEMAFDEKHLHKFETFGHLIRSENVKTIYDQLCRNIFARNIAEFIALEMHLRKHSYSSTRDLDDSIRKVYGLKCFNCGDSTSHSIFSILENVFTKNNKVVREYQKTLLIQLIIAWANHPHHYRVCQNVSRFDIWFLMNGVSSYSDDGFRQGMSFIFNLTNHFIISRDFVQVGISCSYEDKHQIYLQLGQCRSKEALNAALNDAINLTSKSSFGAALQRVFDENFNASVSHNEEARENVGKYLVFVTNGKSADELENAALQFHTNNIQVFAIGVGRDVNMTELELLASKPKKRYVYKLQHFKELHYLTQHVLASIRRSMYEKYCSEIMPLQESHETKIKIGGKERKTVLVNLSPNDVLVLNITSPTNFHNATGYISSVSMEPNKDLYDMAIILEREHEQLLIDGGMISSHYHSMGSNNSSQDDNASLPIYFTIVSTKKTGAELHVFATFLKNMANQYNFSELDRYGVPPFFPFFPSSIKSSRNVNVSSSSESNDSDTKSSETSINVNTTTQDSSTQVTSIESIQISATSISAFPETSIPTTTTTKKSSEAAEKETTHTTPETTVPQTTNFTTTSINVVSEIGNETTHQMTTFNESNTTTNPDPPRQSQQTAGIILFWVILSVVFAASVITLIAVIIAYVSKRKRKRVVPAPPKSPKSVQDGDVSDHGDVSYPSVRKNIPHSPENAKSKMHDLERALTYLNAQFPIKTYELQKQMDSQVSPSAKKGNTTADKEYDYDTKTTENSVRSKKKKSKPSKEKSTESDEIEETPKSLDTSIAPQSSMPKRSDKNTSKNSSKELDDQNAEKGTLQASFEVEAELTSDTATTTKSQKRPDKPTKWVVVKNSLKELSKLAKANENGEATNTDGSKIDGEKDKVYPERSKKKKRSNSPENVPTPDQIENTGTTGPQQTASIDSEQASTEATLSISQKDKLKKAKWQSLSNDAGESPPTIVITRSTNESLSLETSNQKIKKITDNSDSSGYADESIVKDTLKVQSRKSKKSRDKTSARDKKNKDTTDSNNTKKNSDEENNQAEELASSKHDKPVATVKDTSIDGSQDNQKEPEKNSKDNKNNTAPALKDHEKTARPLKKSNNDAQGQAVSDKTTHINDPSKPEHFDDNRKKVKKTSVDKPSNETDSTDHKKNKKPKKAKKLSDDKSHSEGEEDSKSIGRKSHIKEKPAQTSYKNRKAHPNIEPLKTNRKKSGTQAKSYDSAPELLPDKNKKQENTSKNLSTSNKYKNYSGEELKKKLKLLLTMKAESNELTEIIGALESHYADNMDDLTLNVIIKAKAKLQALQKDQLLTKLKHALGVRDLAVITSSLTEIEHFIGDGVDQDIIDSDHELSTNMEKAKKIGQLFEKIEKRRQKIVDLKMSSLEKICAYPKPPTEVRNVMEAAFILLGEDQEKLISWKVLQSLIRKPGDEGVQQRMIQLKNENISKYDVQKVQDLLSDLTLEDVKETNKCAAAFYQWIHSVMAEVEDRISSS